MRRPEPITATCVHCGRWIMREYRAGPAYWYHPDTDRTWCYDPNDPTADPRRRYLKAEPQP